MQKTTESKERKETEGQRRADKQRKERQTKGGREGKAAETEISASNPNNAALASGPAKGGCGDTGPGRCTAGRRATVSSSRLRSLVWPGSSA